MRFGQLCISGAYLNVYTYYFERILKAGFRMCVCAHTVARAPVVIGAYLNANAHNFERILKAGFHMGTYG